MKKWLLYLFLGLLSIALPKLYHWSIAGFSLKKIYYEESFDPKFISHPFSDEIAEILKQDFYYLGQGRQVFVFESADKKHVLKLVRFNHYKMPFRYEFLLSLGLKPKDTHQTRRTHYQRFFTSYKMALEELSDLTGVVFVHLNPTSAEMPQVTIHDRLKRPLKISLDQTAFLIQKKGVPLLQVKEQEMEKVIDSFFQTILTYKEKDVVHYDLPNLIRNVGFYQGHYMEMDVGSYEKRPKDKHYWKRELENISQIFVRFLEKNAPHCIPYFEQKKAEVKQSL